MAEKIEIDKTSGSMAFNRLDMQISQAILLSIEVYTNLDFLLVMDFYDDIALFDDSKNPNSVCYYQMKTTEPHFTFNTIISNEWLDKLYEHINNSQYIINELALITNCPIKETEQPVKEYKNSRTAFTLFNENTKNKITKDISLHFNIPEDKVDLSKFVHIKTNLTINKHKDLAEHELADFLYNDYKNISYDSIKVIYQSLVMLLTKKQEYEAIEKTASFETVRKHKGVSKDDIQSIINRTLLIRIPPFETLSKVLKFDNEKELHAALEYSRILADSNTKSDEFYKIVEKIDYLIQENNIAENEGFPSYVNRLSSLLPPNLLFNNLYITLLITSIYINKQE